MSTKENDGVWQSYGLRFLLTTASHPIEYAKVLIQIGHEPLLPQPTTTFFGKPALKLPNVFQYVRHIKSVDGFTGCYRGLVPKLCGNIASAIACQRVLVALDYEQDNSSSNEDQSDTQSNEDQHEHQQLSEFQYFLQSLRKDLISRFTAILVSHPFHVITIRMMAQFVGKEAKYNGLFGSVVEVYKENGVSGFFHGFVPRAMGEIISVLLANTLAFAVNTYILEENDLKVYSSATISFLASALTYPFQVVSNCVAVSNSGLIAGSPPYMPRYTSWLDCWSNLSESNQLKRGSSLLVRYYTGPQVVIGGQPMPIAKRF